MSDQKDPIATPLWYCGFEEPMPGDFYSLDGSAYTQNGKPNPGFANAWTVTDEQVYKGKYAYKGWILRPQNKSHRAYPCIHLKEFPSPLVNSFMVWLDVDSSRFAERDWVHFATWCNSHWGRGLHTMSVKGPGLIMEMAHCRWTWVGPNSMRAFPLRQWVRFTYYANYLPKGDGKLFVWMDGTLIFEAEKMHSDPNFQSGHWGMYASGGVDNGVQYNDEIQFWSLSRPLENTQAEPLSPYGPYEK